MLTLPADLFDLAVGDSVSKRNLYDLIQYSKQEGSPHWGGAEDRIGNTPQQGINWIGQPPGVKGVIIKTRPGSYAHDGWTDETGDAYRYSFKARMGVVDHEERANRVLIDQPMKLYPVLLFTEAGNQWRFEGRFAVTEATEEFVVLNKDAGAADTPVDAGEMVWKEGRRRYVTHLLAERSRAMSAFLKSASALVCDICDDDVSARYGVQIIDVHHRTPLASWTGEQRVTAADIALVCPNCHRAVHARMQQLDAAYDDIRMALRERLAAPP